jgi:hypothetical protein
MAFYMMGVDEKFKIKLKKAEMSVRQLTIRDEVVEVHNKTVMNAQFGPFNYPIARCKVTKQTLALGSRAFQWTHTDTTQIPTRLVIGFVKESASSGTVTENPFHFRNYGLQNIMVKFDDVKLELNTDFTDGNVNAVRAYNQLFKETGILAAGKTCDITLEEFVAGYTLFVFDLTADKTPEDSRINLLRQGQVTISTKFANPTPHPIAVIVCSFYDNLVQLTADRLPVTDYHMA